jgi:V8-like Glu-specific endopeptidase
MKACPFTVMDCSAVERNEINTEMKKHLEGKTKNFTELNDKHQEIKKKEGLVIAEDDEDVYFDEVMKEGEVSRVPSAKDMD